MTIRVEINPNLRLDGVYTIAEFSDVVGGMPQNLEVVEVFEGTTGLVGRGWVTGIDDQDETLTIFVDWSSMVLPSNQATAASPMPTSWHVGAGERALAS